MTNIRFHLIALSVLMLLVVIIFAATGQFSKKEELPAQATEEAVGDHFITVWEAHWGVNCNDAPILTNKNITPEGNKPIERNNVLSRISTFCNGKRLCEFNVDSKSFGDVASNRSCAPEMELRYRCFEFDRLWKVSVPSGGKIKLECKEQ